MWEFQGILLYIGAPKVNHDRIANPPNFFAIFMVFMFIEVFQFFYSFFSFLFLMEQADTGQSSRRFPEFLLCTCWHCSMSQRLIQTIALLRAHFIPALPCIQQPHTTLSMPCWREARTYNTNRSGEGEQQRQNNSGITGRTARPSALHKGFLQGYLSPHFSMILMSVSPSYKGTQVCSTHSWHRHIIPTCPLPSRAVPMSPLTGHTTGLSSRTPDEVRVHVTEHAVCRRTRSRWTTWHTHCHSLQGFSSILYFFFACTLLKSRHMPCDSTRELEARGFAPKPHHHDPDRPATALPSLRSHTTYPLIRSRHTFSYSRLPNYDRF